MQPAKCDYPLTGLGWLEYYPSHNVYHPGKDYNSGYGNDDCGQEVVAAKSGFVVFVWDSDYLSGGFGKRIVIHHADGNYSTYSHLKKILVKEGQEVKEGKLIGYVGNTGTNYCHLHFEVINQAMADIQTKHWKRWRYYPSGWEKHEVAKYYLDPDEWLEQKPIIPSWAVEGTAFCEKEGIMTKATTNEDYRLATMLHRLYKLIIKK
jgi:murein DD-endopeptidase MepM/ murein hydrolase activator NlpD